MRRKAPPSRTAESALGPSWPTWGGRDRSFGRRRPQCRRAARSLEQGLGSAGRAGGRTESDAAGVEQPSSLQRALPTASMNAAPERRHTFQGDRPKNAAAVPDRVEVAVPINPASLKARHFMNHEARLGDSHIDERLDLEAVAVHVHVRQASRPEGFEAVAE